ncbi:DNA methyltransferase [Mesomycoplasma ovipneumoniae]|uniref:DNA methyltransferase n=1 Tax=Mesomycoplasma ovipneumoniae TaxID=29562 RepID=A0AAJ2P8C1_9BACT|nr:DNA methyltransferase [Mesomycoplasma ovipneumoniae]MDW2906461.1 DNA methyltransferase [Mesomycoplasma ovipneumoniae]MDW2914365.1 DNA methyltransferase [Mesomycoplasma ovipneumoniae]
MSIDKIKVYSDDCFKILPAIKEESIDMIFADHHTQKPIYLLEKLIRATIYEIELILDPFADTGTS